MKVKVKGFLRSMKRTQETPNLESVEIVIALTGKLTDQHEKIRKLLASKAALNIYIDDGKE